MVGRMRGAVCTLLGWLVAWSVCSAALAQDAPARAEVVPTPAASPTTAPAETPPQYRPDVEYGPLQAGRDAYNQAEQQRRWAIDRQLWLISDVRRYNTWYPYVDRYALPYIYSYAPPRVARRVHKSLQRDWSGRVFTPWPQVPGDVYGYPYYPRIKQPIGHEKIQTGPNGYIYRPVYEEPPKAQQVPTPAAPSAPAPALPEARPPEPPPAIPPAQPAPQPALIPPNQPPAEPIPAPPIGPGPREF